MSVGRGFWKERRLLLLASALVILATAFGGTVPAQASNEQPRVQVSNRYPQVEQISGTFTGSVMNPRIVLQKMDCNGCGLVKPGFPDERTFSNVDSYRVFYDVYYDLGRGDYDFVGTVQLDIYGPARVGDKPTYSVDVRDEYDNHVPDTSLGVKVLATHSLADPNLVFATMEVNPPFA